MFIPLAPAPMVTIRRRRVVPRGFSRMGLSSFWEPVELVAESRDMLDCQRFGVGVPSGVCGRSI